MKYPRTPHLLYSPGFSKDDIQLESDDHFIGMNIIITEKLDGENTSLYYNKIHHIMNLEVG